MIMTTHPLKFRYEVLNTKISKNVEVKIFTIKDTLKMTYILLKLLRGQLRELCADKILCLNYIAVILGIRM